MKKKMKIGMMITGHFTIPPPKGIIYAPMTIAKYVAEGLTKEAIKFIFSPRKVLN